MAQAGSMATKKLQGILISPNGVAGTLSVIGDLNGVQTSPFRAQQVIAANVAPEVIEKSAGTQYPAIHVYCSKVTNALTEKFRTFSGEAEMVVETRVSQDRLDGLEAASQMYVDAVTRVLDQSRGDWGDGVSYNGGYEVSYGPVKHGGRNFIQVAKTTFAVDISTD